MSAATSLCFTSLFILFLIIQSRKLMKLEIQRLCTMKKVTVLTLIMMIIMIMMIMMMKREREREKEQRD